MTRNTNSKGSHNNITAQRKKIALINNDGYFHESVIHFYDMNPAGRGLDFDKFPSQKADFLKYAVRFNCVNPIRDITKRPRPPPLEEIAHGIHV